MQQLTPPHYCFRKEKQISGNKRTRSAGLDIVRTIACLSVIASHYFLYTDFNTFHFDGVSMFLQGMLASFVIGSDLYMILTGFLCANKTFGRQFYKSGIKVLLSYVVFSLLTIVVNVYVFHTGMTWKSGVLGIFSFSTIPYAWYIEMWIGLFLLAPFLNIWYKAISSKRMKLYLLGLLYLLTGLPDFFNRYGLYIMPQFWENVYPLAFYFTGCFIREYRPQFRKLHLLFFAFLIMIFSPTVTLLIDYPTFLHIIGDRNGLFIAGLAIAVFLTFYNTNIKALLFRNIFKMISLRSLDIFLCSAILDYYLYPLFKSLYYTDQPSYGVFYFVIVLIIFVICYTIASIKRIFFNLFQWMLNYCGVELQLQPRT